MDSININIDLTPKMIDKLTDKILVKGGKRVIEAIAERAVVEKKKEVTEIVYTVKEVAEITKQSTQTVHNHIKHEILKATRLGKDFRITETNLKNYINGNGNK